MRGETSTFQVNATHRPHGIGDCSLSPPHQLVHKTKILARETAATSEERFSSEVCFPAVAAQHHNCLQEPPQVHRIV